MQPHVRSDQICPNAGSTSRGASPLGVGSSVALFGIASLLLSWVALINKAPLVFADSLMYATAALQRELPAYFSVFYSVFVFPFHQCATLWPIVFVQGALLAHLLYISMRCVVGHLISGPGFLATICLLAVFSSLPWLTGQILPDVFTPVVLLGFFLLSICPDRLERWELPYVAVLTSAAITFHLSHVPLAAGLVILCLVLKPLFGPPHPRGAKWLALVVSPLLVAAPLMLAVNWAATRQLSLARDSDVFMLAKLINDGPALSYLTTACPDADYALCAYLDDLRGRSHDELKWAGDSPFRKIGSPDQLQPEAHAIVRATLAAYPAEILARSLADAGRQLLKFQAGDGLSPDFARMVARHLETFFGPETARSLVESRQGKGLLPIDTARRLHVVGLVFGIGFCLLSGLALRDLLPKRVIALYVFLALGIVGNALVTGGLSGPYDRYLARVIWLLCFAGLVGAYCIEPPGQGRALHAAPNHRGRPD